MVLEVFSKLNGSVVSEREYGGSQVTSLEMEVVPCCLVSCSQAGMVLKPLGIKPHFRGSNSTRELLSNKKFSFLPGHMCRTTNKTCFMWRIPYWKQCIGSVEERQWLPGEELQQEGKEGVEVLLCLQDGLWGVLTHLCAGLSQRSGTVPGSSGGKERLFRWTPWRERLSLSKVMLPCLGLQILALAWSVWEPGVQALQNTHLHCTPTKLIHISHVEMKVCPPIWVCPSR